MELLDLAKKEYESLKQEISKKETELLELKKKIHPVEVFLKEAGVIERESRNRK